MTTALIDGLSLLLRDNARRREPIERQAHYWMNLREQDIQGELELLTRAKTQWFYGSVVAWQIISIAACAVVADMLWARSFTLEFSGLLLILGTWVGTLFLVWLVASLFDRQAGFERWFEAFKSRAPLSPDSDSAQTVSETLDMVRAYPSVLRYEQGVLAHRRLRHEDLRIMREMGLALRHEDLTRALTTIAQPA